MLEMWADGGDPRGPAGRAQLILMYSSELWLLAHTSRLDVSCNKQGKDEAQEKQHVRAARSSFTRLVLFPAKQATHQINVCMSRVQRAAVADWHTSNTPITS